MKRKCRVDERGRPVSARPVTFVGIAERSTAKSSETAGVAKPSVSDTWTVIRSTEAAMPAFANERTMSGTRYSVSTRAEKAGPGATVANGATDDSPASSKEFVARTFA